MPRSLPPHGSNGHNKPRPVLDGKTHIGFRFEMHEEKHVHEEAMVIVNEVAIGDAVSPLGPKRARDFVLTLRG